MDGSPLSPNDLESVDGVAALLDLLQEKLGWELGAEDVDDLDDVTYDWGPEELALKPEHRAKLREIKQLRPFHSDQDWAVFFVSFESEGRLPVAVLRRVLRGLTLRGRNASAENAAWRREDILFISAFGKGAERELAFAHFHDDAGGDLPRLSVLGWDEADTDRRKALTAARAGGLSYEPGESAEARRRRWREAFRGTKRQAITDSKTLAKELAVLAAAIRSRVNELIAAEDETGHLRRMHAAFQRTLIEGLSADEFADTFAQTVAYGLLTAAFSRTSGALVMQDLVHMVPPTNPFLRGLFERFLHMGGQDHDQLLDYDELGLREVIDLLQAADLEAVRADFGARKPGEDPVIHFYEDFLSAYDKKQKVDAGVFYTPQPVVNFIVRGVDQMLREEFGLPLGLADRATLGEVAARLPGVTVPEGQDPDQPFVRILDPATGTGTFLVEAIERIHRRMMEHWRGESDERRRALWQAYVAEHLLPNMSAFELKMAPYAIAHMKVGLKLQDTGYDLAAGERLRVFLTNAMQPARAVEQAEMDFDVEVLAEEAAAANAAKRERHSVVVGNPPYAGHSKNNGEWITALLKGAEREVLNFYQFEGRPLGERKVWLNDDYVKFISLAYHYILGAQGGVIGYITNNGWFDGATFRGMRESIVSVSGDLRILNLEGSVKRPVRADDQNVFDIQQGVSIIISAVTTSLSCDRKVHYGTVVGTRSKKFGSLESFTVWPFKKIAMDRWKNFRFGRGDGDEYVHHFPINSIFLSGSTSVQTSRDAVSVFMTLQEAQEFLDGVRSHPSRDNPLLSGLRDGRNFDLDQMIHSISRAREDGEEITLTRYLYRVYDHRILIDDDKVINWPRREVMKHVKQASESVALLSPRQLLGNEYRHVWVTNAVPDMCAVSAGTREASQCFPLFLRSTRTEPRRPNVAPAFARALAARTVLTWDDGLPRMATGARQAAMDLGFGHQPDLNDQGRPETWDGRAKGRAFGPRDLFDYIYAVLHAPSYRTRYAEFLRSDFPRIPLPGGADPAGLFRALAAHGRRLTALHLLDVDAAPELRAPAIRLAGTGSTQLGKASAVEWEDGKVRINGERWFETVPEEVWDFRIGGYQPAQKWLKDRAGKGGKNARDGRVLTEADVLHYRRFVTAMRLTIPEMAAVDATIEAHGGWPAAFAIPSG